MFLSPILVRLKKAASKKRSPFSSDSTVIKRDDQTQKLAKEETEAAEKRTRNRTNEEIKQEPAKKQSKTEKLVKKRTYAAKKRTQNGANDEIEEKPVKKRNKTEKRPPNKVRYDTINHFPKIDKSHAVRCKNEDCNFKTFMLCMKCKVHLCLVDERNCFTQFHFIDKVDV